MEVRGFVGQQQIADIESVGELMLLLAWLLGRNGNPLHKQSVHSMYGKGIRILR